jgi:hypothetical protein
LYIDGCDLLAELHPRKTLDIKRRVDGVETWFEGDWLSTVWDAVKEAKAYLYSRDIERAATERELRFMAQRGVAETPTMGSGCINFASGMPLSENNADCSRPKAGSPTAEGGDAQTEGE